MKTEFTPENLERLIIKCLDSFEKFKDAKQQFENLKKPFKKKSMTVDDFITYKKEYSEYSSKVKDFIFKKDTYKRIYEVSKTDLTNLIPEYNQWFIVNNKKYAVGLIDDTDRKSHRKDLIITDQVNNLKDLDFHSYLTFAEGNLLGFD